MATRRDRGEGSIYRVGNRWRVRVRYSRAEDQQPNQGLIQKTFHTKREALEKLPELQAEAERREVMAPEAIRREEQRLSEYLASWHRDRAANRKIRPKTERDELLCVKRITGGFTDEEGRRMPGLGHIPIGKLTVYTIDDWFSRLTTFWKDSPDHHLAMRQRMFATLRKALNDAKLGNRNPIIGADTPTAKADARSGAGPTVFSDAELRAVLAAADRHENLPFSTLVWLLAVTGVRIGEGLALIWGNVNLDRDRPSVVIDASLSEATKAPTRGPTKTGKVREVGIPASLADRLRRLRIKRGPMARIEDFVFGTGLGTPLRQSNVMRRLWHPLLDSAGIARTGFHRLRHTHASLLLAEGRPITEVSARLGHESVRTTLMVYSHAMPGSDDKTTALLDEWLARSSSKSS